MRNFGRLIGVFLLILSAGCVRLLHPLYTEQDVIFDPRLVGVWSTENPRETMEFSKRGETDYQLTYTDDGKSGKFVVHLLRIDGKLFLDLLPQQEREPNQNDFYESHFLPVHSLIHIKQIEPTFQMRVPQLDWLHEFLKDNPKAIRHEKIGPQIILTASTKELQTFWLKHLDTKDAFQESEILKRQTKAVPDDQPNKPDAGDGK